MDIWMLNVNEIKVKFGILLRAKKAKYVVHITEGEILPNPCTVLEQWLKGSPWLHHQPDRKMRP